jgi:hypothetical protein
MKVSHRIPLLIIGLLLSSGCVPIPYTRVWYQDDKVTVTELGVTWMVHGGGGTNMITVFGSHYLDVRGAGPCYLEIPGKNELLFVTGGYGKAVVHLVDLTSHKETHFPAYDSNIGKQISGEKNGKYEFERIESVTDDLLIISSAQTYSADIDRHFKQFIDLKTPKFIRQEYDYYDSFDKQRHHDVYEGGKKPPSK